MAHRQSATRRSRRAKGAGYRRQTESVAPGPSIARGGGARRRPEQAGVRMPRDLYSIRGVGTPVVVPGALGAPARADRLRRPPGDLGSRARRPRGSCRGRLLRPPDRLPRPRGGLRPGRVRAAGDGALPAGGRSRRAVSAPDAQRSVQHAPGGRSGRRGKPPHRRRRPRARDRPAVAVAGAVGSIPPGRRLCPRRRRDPHVAGRPRGAPPPAARPGRDTAGRADLGRPRSARCGRARAARPGQPGRDVRGEASAV